MDVESLILVSVDDHCVEPPDMFEGRLPAKYADLAPKLITREEALRRIEPSLIQPTIIYDYPVEVSPLSKKKPDERGLGPA